MKSDTVFKRAYNDALDLLSSLQPGDPLPSENALGVRLGVSRTTIRKVLAALGDKGIVTLDGHERMLARNKRAVRRFPEAETISMSAQVEKRFMEWMLRDDTRPGTSISERELARQFGVATNAIREFLNRFQRFGLIEKRPNAGWLFKGFTPSFALELFEIRELFELRAANAFVALPEVSPKWAALRALRDEHVLLLAEIELRFHDFSGLDSRFHRLVISAAPNRFVEDFYDIISLIFHYHYQWDKQDERQRNTTGIREHLTYMDALEARNGALVDLACRAHLATAKDTLMRATSS